MFQNLTKTQQTTAAGIILGGIFGVSTGVSFVRGWDLVMIFGIPLTLGEVWNLLNDCMPLMFAGVGFGSAVGALYSSFITKSKLVAVIALLALVALFLIVDFALVLLIFFPYFIQGVGPAMLIGGGILALYRTQKSFRVLVPLVMIGGFFAAYIPWKMNGAIGYVDVMQQTNRYAVQAHLSNYHIEYWGRGTAGSSAGLYLADGTILKCGYGGSTAYCEPLVPPQ